MAVLSNWETLERLLVAAALGSLIGFERERLLWAAGIRTHMLVCVGACLFMMVSAYGFSDSLSAQHVVLDPSRVAAQVVSGIGFLGAGAILARGEVVKGLTTAASIWTVAAIGLATGGGLYFAAMASTAAIIAILAGVKPLEEAYRARNQRCRLNVEAERATITPELLKERLAIRSGQIKRFLVKAGDGDEIDDITIVIDRIASQDVAQLVAGLKRIEGVKRVIVAARSTELAEPT
ncbi:MAG TPA: MgtC/SapB family protein [Xanthobacteraceae bacterium]|nr:MgtC/SapB family protein [Xanthobacteraceae bacterium]